VLLRSNVNLLVNLAYIVTDETPDARAREFVADAWTRYVKFMKQAFDREIDVADAPLSAADIPDWLMPQQEKSIPTQLEDGIRGLLFDVHYGIPVEGRVKTDLDSDLGSREKFDKAVGKEGIDAAMRIRDRLAGKPEGPRGLYLCHGFCELGPRLSWTRSAPSEFLVRNPDGAVSASRTTPRRRTSPPPSPPAGSTAWSTETAPWPLLREMIDSRQRVVVLLSQAARASPSRPARGLLRRRVPLRRSPRCRACPTAAAGRIALPDEQLDRQHPQPQAQQRRHRQRLRRAPGPRPALARASAGRPTCWRWTSTTRARSSAWPGP
jgi:hypothetical protein